MDPFDVLMGLVVAGAGFALWWAYRKPKKVSHQGRIYARQRDGSFRDERGAAVTDPVLRDALAAEYQALMQARDARLASSAD